MVVVNKYGIIFVVNCEINKEKLKDCLSFDSINEAQEFICKTYGLTMDQVVHTEFGVRKDDGDYELLDDRGGISPIETSDLETWLSDFKN